MAVRNFIIDCHVHVTPDGKWFNTGIIASLDRLMEELSSSSIKKVVLLPVGKDKEELIKGTNYVISLTHRYPENITGFAGYYPGFDINQVTDNHLAGIKIHPRQNQIDVLDRKIFPFYEAAAKKNLPILFDSYCTPISDMPLEKIRPSIYATIAKAFPSLKIILAHCGMPFIWDAYTVLKWHDNVFGDLSHILEYFKNTSLLIDLGWVVRKIPHKFIYGSDFPEMRINSYFGEFETFCQNHNIRSKEIINNFHKILNGHI
jgi:hypothetical protein